MHKDNSTSARSMYFAILAVIFFLQIPLSSGAQPGYLIRCKDLAVRLSGNGEIVGIQIGKNGVEKKMTALSSVEGCSQQGKTRVRKNKNGGLEFSGTLTSDSLSGGDENSCVVTEKFFPTRNSIRWVMEIRGQGKPWSAAINTGFNYPANKQTRFWTTWGAPPFDSASADPSLREKLRPVAGGSIDSVFIGPGNNQWTDPLQEIPFPDTAFYYGLPYFTYEHPRTFICPFQGNLISIPLCSILETAENEGLSFALSPEDDIVDLVMHTRQNGAVLFSRLFNRISKDHPFSFSLDIIAHEADWRAGLGWVAARYPGYFLPVNKDAYQLGGTGAYSSFFEISDRDQLNQMDFKTNWQASFDFPYMGMFLPPVDRTTRWKRFGDGTISLKEMNDYAHRMKTAGFHVLNYFNVTEFGTRIQYPAPAYTTSQTADWKDCNSFLYKEFSGALLHTPLKMQVKEGGKTQPGGPLYTWEGAIVTDCGDTAYRSFLLNQARRHVRDIPDADGICIDRIDWLRFFNEQEDDGSTWFDGKPVRSLIHSFKQLMDSLGPIMHHANKNIFLNNHDKRIDIGNQTDGIFDEFSYAGAPLNLSAFLCVYKPAIGWTDSAATVKNEGPDNFFQKYLYMGVFPMCPYPANDHSILPDSLIDSWYRDYGPLLKLLYGRTWVLKPHVIAVDNDLAKVNAFETPGGYAIPVVYGKAEQVRVRIDEGKLNRKGQAAAEYTVWQPGKSKAIPVSPIRKGKLVYLDVPLVRGCAVVSVRR